MAISNRDSTGLPLEGGSLSGNLDMNGNDIVSSGSYMSLGAYGTSTLPANSVVVGSAIDLKGVATFSSRATISTSGRIRFFGNAAAGGVEMALSVTYQQFVCSVGATAPAYSGNQLILGPVGATTDYDHVVPTNPTFFVHSVTNPNTDNTQWVSLNHDQTDGIVNTGVGGLKVLNSGTSGITIKAATQSLTFAANPGDASKVTSGLIPAGAILLGITTRVTTTGTNGTSMNIGDGTDADMYAATAAITANSTTDFSDVTAAIEVSQAAAGEVTVTAVGGNIFDMVIAVTAHYIDTSAATS